MIQFADRLHTVEEYYFSKKLREVRQLISEGKPVINIGIGKVSINDFRTIIESKDRGKAGFSVPAHGLYLVKVEYPYIESK